MKTRAKLTSIEKYQKSGNRDKVLDYQESIDTFTKWKRRVNR